MDFITYFQPDNAVGVAIVYGLLALFGLWFMGLVASTLYLLVRRSGLQAARNVDMLAASVSEAAASSDQVEDANVFQRFCRIKDLKSGAPEAAHLQAIYEAGLNQSRLEVDNLILHTSRQFFQHNGFLRSLLALFIVIGLLGTLFGLADSLARLADPLQAEGWNEEQLKISLGSLLLNLRGAFAPSLLGVLLTVIGVIIYSAYLWVVCGPLQRKLERLTLTVWVPKLYPTTTQRMYTTLLESERQMRKSFEAAQQVANFAGEIEGEIKTLKPNLTSANQAIGTLTDSSSAIQQFADKLTGKVGELSGFQTSLQQLYQQMLDNSKTFQEQVQASITKAETFQQQNTAFLEKQTETLQEQVQGSITQAQSVQQENKAILEKQAAQVEAMLGSLKLYETGYIEQRGKVDATLQHVLEATRSVLADIEARNEMLITALTGPIVKTLGDKLGTLTTTQQQELSALQQQLQAMENPLKEAADRMGRIAKAVVERAQDLNRDLQHEFNRQNEAYEERTEAISKISGELSEMMVMVAGITAKQEEQVQEVGEQAKTLADQVKALGRQVQHLTETLPRVQRPPSRFETSRPSTHDDRKAPSWMPNLDPPQPIRIRRRTRRERFRDWWKNFWGTSSSIVVESNQEPVPETKGPEGVAPEDVRRHPSPDDSVPSDGKESSTGEKPASES